MGKRSKIEVNLGHRRVQLCVQVVAAAAVESSNSKSSLLQRLLVSLQEPISSQLAKRSPAVTRRHRCGEWCGRDRPSVSYMVMIVQYRSKTVEESNEERAIYCIQVPNWRI